MSDSLEPAWELLPGDPEGFFNVSGEYDVRDLKRSYNQLIRRYKPEKFPEQFQKIRAAFESLNDALRFHLPRRSFQSPELHRTSLVSVSAGVESSRPHHTAETNSEPSVGHVAPRSPEELLVELESKQHRTSSDYVGLAVLADVLPARTSRSFYDWLLTGMAEHPDDWGLLQLLREYLAEAHPVSDLPEMLTRAVAIVSPDRFQYCTERAWDRLFREATFEQYRHCLETCGQQLGQALGMAQPLFYVHVMRMALWTADERTIREMQEVVEDNFEHLDSWASLEYDLTAQLLEYLRQRKAFTARGPACCRIDQAMRDWCLLREEDGDLSVLDALYFLSQQGSRLLSELPGSEESLTVVLLPWERIVDDVLQRQDSAEPVADQALAQHARNFMIRAMRRHKRIPQHLAGLSLVVLALGIACLSLVAGIALLIRLGWKWFALGQVLGGVFDGLLAAFVLAVGFALAIWVFIRGRRISRLRYQNMRGELINLLRVAPVPIRRLCEVILQRENERFGAENDQSIDDTHFVAHGLLHDPAMALFALAQQALHAASAEVVVDAAIVLPAEERQLAPTRPLGRQLG